jgi:hypothetical protein
MYRVTIKEIDTYRVTIKEIDTYRVTIKEIDTYKVTIKEIDTFNGTQYQNPLRSGHTICIVGWRKDENFFPGILSYFVSILAKSLIVLFNTTLKVSLCIMVQLMHLFVINFKTFQITPTCFDHQMIIIREFFVPG